MLGSFVSRWGFWLVFGTGVVADVSTLNPEDYIFSDVGGVVSNALQIAGDQKGIEGLPHCFRTLIHGLHELDESIILHAVNHVVHFEHGLCQLSFALDEGFERAPTMAATAALMRAISTGRSTAGSSTISMTRSAILTA